MAIVAAIIGFLLGLVSLLGVIIYGLLIIINKLKGQVETSRKFKKPLIISSLLVVLSLIIILGGATLFGEKVPNEEPGTITKAQYKQIKEGMTKDEITDILGSPSSKDDDIRQWSYIGIDGVEENAEATFYFESDDTLDYKLDKGITRKIDPTESTSTEPSEPTNEDYDYGVEFTIEEAVGETVEWDDETLDVVDQLEVNDNYGKNDGSKLILAHLNAPVSLTSKLTKKTVQKQTLEIAKSIKESTTLDFEVDSITYFWYLPLTDAAGNTERSLAYKIQLERDTLDNLNYDSLSSIDLPAIADQYNVMFNDQ